MRFCSADMRSMYKNPSDSCFVFSGQPVRKVNLSRSDVETDFCWCQTFSCSSLQNVQSCLRPPLRPLLPAPLHPAPPGGTGRVHRVVRPAHCRRPARSRASGSLCGAAGSSGCWERLREETLLPACMWVHRHSAGTGSVLDQSMVPPELCLPSASVLSGWPLAV